MADAMAEVEDRHGECGSGRHCAEPQGGCSSRTVPHAGLRLAAVGAVAAVFAAVLFAGREDDEFAFVAGPMSDGEPHRSPHEAHGPAMPLQHVEEQIEQLRKQAAAAPEDYMVRVKLANTLFNVATVEKKRGGTETWRRRWLEAAAVYTEALRLKDSPDVRCDLGTCYFELERYDEALETFKGVLATQPDHGNAAFNLGMALRAKGDADGAAKQWEDLVRKQPDSVAGKQAKDNLQKLKNTR